ncbi:MAG: hypothetical protein F4Z31_07150 [Gemmatimonadetes bacterium]|nr:hypothetical protein [Gemmatimonadota bacterium]MYJ12174.1 hypothetical protein [Gemmatimonadota bacterium]
MPGAAMSARKRKAKTAKAKDTQPSKDGEAFGWNPDTGGLLKGTKFAKPPCPVGFHGYHQYTRDREQDTKRCRVHVCRLCDRTLTVNRKTGNVREERSAA